MGRLFLDATGNYSDPASTKLRYLRADGQWAAPDSAYKFLDAAGEWTAPELGTPAGDLQVGSTLKFLSLWGEPIVWRVIGKDLPGMPANSVTLLADKIIAVLPFDGMEPTNSDSDRKRSGNNDWVVSNLRQWLNSDKGAGAWYSAQHSEDQPPDKAHVTTGYNAYDALAGFLNGASANEKNALLETDRNIGGWSSNAKICKDRVFLLTSNEYGLETIANNGSRIPYFADNADLQAYPTNACVSHSDWPNVPGDIRKTWYYWTSTSRSSNSYEVCAVRPDKALGFDTACQGYDGVRPACNLSAKAGLPESAFA